MRHLLLTLIKVAKYAYYRCSSVIIVNGYLGPSLSNNNFGDDINIPLLKALTGKKVIALSDTGLTFIPHLLCIGSVIGRLNRESRIWGSGAMFENQTLSSHPRKVYAVRGKYTREYLIRQGISCPEVYGDPALLLPLIYPPCLLKKYHIGIIPHYSEYDIPHVMAFRNSHPEILCIKMRGYSSWQEVIDQIVSCDYIISSSLHGLIVSDAYGIPNVFAKFSNLVEGGTFKYRDYFSGVNRIFEEPLDFSGKIQLDVAEKRIAHYSKIEFDCLPLLAAFPYKLQPQITQYMLSLKDISPKS